MKQILYAALLLGCLAVVTAQSGVFEFTDSNGQCWRCAPGVPCERCSIPQIFPPQSRTNPDPWPTTCPQPDCNLPENRGVMFPSKTLRQYYQCDPDNGSGWKVNTLDCPCDTLFSFESQRCLTPWEFVPHCDFEGSDPNFIECNPTTTSTELTTVSTEDPNDTTTTSLDTTSSSPCVCVIWWPCWCNPCMSMPRPPSCMMMG